LPTASPNALQTPLPTNESHRDNSESSILLTSTQGKESIVTPPDTAFNATGRVQQGGPLVNENNFVGYTGPTIPQPYDRTQVTAEGTEGAKGAEGAEALQFSTTNTNESQLFRSPPSNGGGSSNSTVNFPNLPNRRGDIAPQSPQVSSDVSSKAPSRVPSGGLSSINNAINNSTLVTEPPAPAPASPSPAPAPANEWNTFGTPAPAPANEWNTFGNNPAPAPSPVNVRTPSNEFGTTNGQRFNAFETVPAPSSFVSNGVLTNTTASQANASAPTVSRVAPTSNPQLETTELAPAPPAAPAHPPSRVASSPATNRVAETKRITNAQLAKVAKVKNALNATRRLSALKRSGMTEAAIARSARPTTSPEVLAARARLAAEEAKTDAEFARKPATVVPGQEQLFALDYRGPEKRTWREYLRSGKKPLSTSPTFTRKQGGGSRKKSAKNKRRTKKNLRTK